MFTKSEHLYGIDLARQPALDAGYLAVVEGYTDVLMAHQLGITQVVSTMGTALNARHVKHLRFVPRVILVFDADTGGNVGVDRALEIFVSQEVDLAIATLPEELDPCDLLIREGPDAFRKVLEGSEDALDFKLKQVLGSGNGAEGQRRAVDQLLGIIALAPETPEKSGAVKRELVVSRIARRLALREETVWARLKEIRASRRPIVRPAGEETAPARKAPAPERERQLLQVLLADPQLVPVAVPEIAPEEIEHPGLRLLLQGLYALQTQGDTPDLDGLRARIDNPALVQTALAFQERGLHHLNRATWLQDLIVEFRQRRILPEMRELQNQLHAANDHTEAVELLRQIQRQTASPVSALPPAGGTVPGRGGF